MPGLPYDFYTFNEMFTEVSILSITQNFSGTKDQISHCTITFFVHLTQLVFSGQHDLHENQHTK